MSGASGAALAFLKAFVPGRAPPARIEVEPPEAPEPSPEAPLQRQADCGRVSPEVLDPLRLQPEVEQVLLDIGMPPDDSPIYDGKRRAADKPEEAARKFVIWARAIGAVGSYPPGIICALYGECAAADHRVAGLRQPLPVCAEAHARHSPRPGRRRSPASSMDHRASGDRQTAAAASATEGDCQARAQQAAPISPLRAGARNSPTRHDPGQGARGTSIGSGAQAAWLALAQTYVISPRAAAHQSTMDQRPTGRPMRSAIGSNAMQTL